MRIVAEALRFILCLAIVYVGAFMLLYVAFKFQGFVDVMEAQIQQQMHDRSLD